MAKEKVELLTELKQGASQFTLVGKAVIKDGALKGVLQKEGKTWRHVNSSFGVDTGDGNSVYARIWGGYKTDKPTLKRWNSENEFIDIAWNDRLNESIVESVRDAELFRAGFEKDAEGKLITKKFISEIDFEEYLREHLADGMKVRVRGDVEYSEYNENVNRRYNIKSVYLVEPYMKDGVEVIAEDTAFIKQTYLFDEDALKKGWERELDKNGEIVVPVLVPSYVSNRKVGDSYVDVKKTLPLSQAIVVRAKDKTDEAEIAMKKKIIEKFFKVKKGTVREAQLIININEGYEESTGVELNDELRELIEMGVMTEDDIKKQVTIRGNRISELVFKQPAVRKTDDGIVILIDDAKYAPEALIVPMIDGEDDDEDDDAYANEDEEVNLGDDAFAEMFGGI